MAYFTPFIDETGMHIPTFTDIRDDLIAQMQAIFGEDIYIDNDSQDYQQISIQARKIFDCNSTAQLAYNNRTPITAIGVGLDNDVVYANIARKPATNSTVQLTVTGSAGTVIHDGEASDGTNVWNLPETVTIPDNGIITVMATSQAPGNIGALPNSINQIVTPTFGWNSVINNFAASAGVNVETDASLRGRFAMATRQPSQTVFEGIWAAIESINEVTRVRGYENDTGSDSTGTEPPNVPAGLPPHSVTFVVEGGDDYEVATELWQKKTPGCYTNGTTSVQIVSIVGNITTVRFDRPTYNNVYVRVTLKMLPGYNDEYENKIINNISSYITNMALAENVYRSIVWSVATSAMDSINSPAFSVTNVEFSNNGTSWNTNDVIQNYYNAAVTTADMVTVVVT